MVLGCLLLAGTANACVGSIIGASNEQAEGQKTLQLGEALEATITDCHWRNYAVPGSTTPQFIEQAQMALVDNPDVVIVGLTIELFRKKAIDLLHNMNRIAAMHASSRVIFLLYPEEVFRTVHPNNFVRSIDYDLPNLRGFNTHMGYLRDRSYHVSLIEYPQYRTEWYVGGRQDPPDIVDGLHADAASQLSVAAMIKIEMLQTGVIFP